MRALEAGKLLPVRIEAVVPPLGFGQIHALDLLNWNGGRDDPAFVALADEVRKRLGQPLVPRQRYTPRRRYRPAILAGVGLLVAAIVATGGWQFYNASESRRNLRLGLEEQFGREPNLQAARNYYLDALAHMAGNARARYYLGHVYAQLGEMELARTSFERAAHDREGLDEAQLADASMRVAALSPAPEPAALVRADVSSAPPKDLPAPTGAQPAEARPAESRTAERQVKAAPPILGSIGGIRDPSAAASAAALARLPRLPPAPETRRRIDQLVDQMFSDDSETRITANTTLAIDPDLLSDAVPLAVNEAINRLNAGRGKLAASVQSGVFNTLVLLERAMPGTLLVHRGDIERLLKLAKPIGENTAAQAEKVQTLLAGAAERRPVAFIQIANEAQRPIAEALAVRLRVAGYRRRASNSSARARCEQPDPRAGQERPRVRALACQGGRGYRRGGRRRSDAAQRSTEHRYLRDLVGSGSVHRRAQPAEVWGVVRVSHLACSLRKARTTLPVARLVARSSSTP